MTSTDTRGDDRVRHVRGGQTRTSLAGSCFVDTSAADTDTAWVTEVWSSEAELDASLTLESVKGLVEQVVALLAEPPERIDILPVGGKGVDAG